METRVQIHKGGRLVVPVNLRKALKIKIGDEIIVRLEENSIRLIPLQQAVNLAQKTVKQYVPSGVSLADELIKARREEALSE
jgi:bifunctional DNA-binding transcriptional regulator/antitoxin component of YhaV-PrlF toxin-antitoxin module